MFAGDGISVQQQAAIKAGVGVLLQSDYQGDLNGATPANPGPSKFVTAGTVIQIAGQIAAPIILIRGGDGPDRISATSTSVLTLGFPWTSSTYPSAFGTFPATPPTTSELQISGFAGNDGIALLGSLTASNVNIFGGDGADSINFSPTNTQTGVDVIFGDGGTVTYGSTGAVIGITTTDDGIGGNDTIAIGAAANPVDAIVFGGEGSNTITMSDGQGFVFGGDGIMNYTTLGALTTVTSEIPDVVGNNTLNLGAASVIAFGGSGNSTINAGQGSSIIFGHEGEASYGSSGGPLVFVESLDPTDGTGTTIKVADVAADTNVIIGGNGAGNITVGAGTDTIIGHNGLMVWSGHDIVGFVSINPEDAGNETIKMGAGNDIVIGGSGSNTITATGGNQIVLGDNGEILYDSNDDVDSIQSTDLVTNGTTTTAYGGNNTITLGNGNDLVIGGLGANTITVGNGNSSIIASDGTITLTNNVMTTAQTLNPSFGGADTVKVGTGRNVVIGGPGNDTITLAASTTYAVLGGPGTVNYDAAGWANTVALNSPASAATTGTDTITIGTVTQTLSGAGDVLTSGLGTPQFAAAAPPAGHATASTLTEKELEPIVVEAEAIWARVLGPDSARLAILNGITVDIGTLSDGMIGLTQGDVITIDSTADKWGWFTDTSLAGNSEFQRTSMPGVLTAEAGSAAAGEMDLLSTVLHEMGNAMGFPEDTGQDVTGKVLAAGERRLPVPDEGGDAASGLPTIAWGAINTAQSLLPPNADTLSWTDDFLNNMGRGANGKQPNAGFRIKLG
jgi:Ca2+-binding RTX toxin-like protein